MKMQARVVQLGKMGDCPRQFRYCPPFCRLVKVMMIMGLGAIMLLAGCTTLGGTPFRPVEISSEKALIYVYRPRVIVGGAVSYPIYINNQKVTTLPHTGYYAHLVEPGEVFITAKTLENEAHVKLDAVAGEVYYIKGGTATGHFSGRATLSQVHPTQGAAEIKDCAYYAVADELRK